MTSFRLRHVPPAVGPNTDRRARAGDAPPRSLEKKLGTLGSVDTVVHIGDPGFDAARIEAARVRDARSPHFMQRIDRREQVPFDRLAAGQDRKHLRHCLTPVFEERAQRDIGRQKKTVLRPARAPVRLVSR